MKTYDLKGKRTLVVGLGQSGISAANLLFILGACVEITDNRSKTELEHCLCKLKGDFKLHLDGHAGIDISGINLVVVSPGVPWGSVFLQSLRKNKIETISEMEFASRYVEAPIIAITGTNGKTTTVSLIGEIFRKAEKKVFIGGNIGIPLSEYVLSGKEVDYVICEVSTFQLEGVKNFKPYISALLNITPDHLDRHTDMDEYVGLKKRIYENQVKSDFIILNKDDSLVVSLNPQPEVTVHYFSCERDIENGAVLRGDKLAIKKEGKTYPFCIRNDIQIRGLHNVENVLAAAAVASVCEIEPEIVKSAVQEFTGIKNRVEYVTEIDGVIFINDSKGTNVGATVRSIQSVEAPLILIAGGKDKGGDYTQLIEVMKDKVKSLVLIGETSEKISSLINGSPAKVIAGSLKEAVEVAFSMSAEGDVVLLSPACSSFDMFRDYEERGECFRDAVMLIKESRGCN